MNFRLRLLVIGRSRIFIKGVTPGFRVLNQPEAELMGLFGAIALVVNVVAAIALEPAYAAGARKPPGTTTTCSGSSPAKLMREPCP
jgi:hypothetical protein